MCIAFYQHIFPLREVKTKANDLLPIVPTL